MSDGEQIDHPGLTGEMDEQPDHGEDSYVGHGRLKGRVAVVTGGDSGIGRAVAVAFSREGADLVIAHLPEEQQDAERTAALVRDAGRNATLVPGDLSEESACHELVRTAVTEHGRIDVLVVNAAHQMAQPGGIADITTEQLDRTLHVNLYSLFWLCRESLPHLPDGTGSIVVTTSVQSTNPSPALLDYAMTKGAINTFVKGLADEVGDRGIRVNGVGPGPVWTPLIPATMPPDAVASFGEDTPLGRKAQPTELAPAYVFLASADASYVTGEVIMVTGGK